jgi:hypothetical protein
MSFSNMTFVADSNSTDPYADFVAFCEGDPTSGECLLASQASNFQVRRDKAAVIDLSRCAAGLTYPD